MTKQQIIDLEKLCPNLKIGGSCWRWCPYRENGMCELNITKVLSEAIKYLKETT
jgi:hypothetical protein